MPRNVGALDRRNRRARPQLASVALAGGLLLMLGCEGENIFVEDVIPPQVEILDPAGGESVPPETTVLVRANVSDARGVVRVTMEGLAFRPVPGGQVEVVERLIRHEETFEVPVQEAEIEARLYPTEIDVTEPLFLIVTAFDQAGNVGADTVELTIGGPRVSILAPEDERSVRGGTEITVRVHAMDVSGLVLKRLEYYRDDDTVHDADEWEVSGTDVTSDRPFRVPTTEGELTIVARAMNVGGILNRSEPITLTVTSAEAPDTVAPQVAFDIHAPTRMELTDTVRVMASARDDDAGRGVARMGVSVIANRPAGDPAVWSHWEQLVPPGDDGLDGLVEHEFSLNIQDLYDEIDAGFAAGLALPDTLRFEFHALAEDADGNCAAATSTTFASLPCVDRTVNGTTVPVAESAVGRRAEVMVVSGQTIPLPGEDDVIADALVVDPLNTLYLSNFTRNRVEALDLTTLSFRSELPAGSQPWGLFMHNSGDTLIVANSGGTNLDFIPLGGTGEMLAGGATNRIQTPNVVLFQVRREETDGGGFRYTSTAIDFSDRPQFVAQDVYGFLHYSTVPTGSAPDGTARIARLQPGWEVLEAEIIVSDALIADPDGFAIKNADFVWACTVQGTDINGILIQDRIPGTTTEIESGCESPTDAVAAIRGMGSNVVMFEAVRWNPDRIGLSDTTFVAASGDRHRVVYGEGAAETGRIFMWEAHPDPERIEDHVSDDIQVVDLIHNEPARVTGIALNQDGELGVARGTHGTYFFDPNLRLQGRIVEDMVGGAGAGMHPEHSGLSGGAHRFSFVGSDDRSILVLDTHGFTTLGEIPVRDRIIGPLKVSNSLPGDPADTLVRVYAVTDTGGVLLIRVRESDAGL